MWYRMSTFAKVISSETISSNFDSDASIFKNIMCLIIYSKKVWYSFEEKRCLDCYRTLLKLYKKFKNSKICAGVRVKSEIE